MVKTKRIPRWLFFALVLFVLGVLLTGIVSAQTPGHNPLVPPSGVDSLSGGQYTLLVSTPAAPQTAGYRLLPAAPAVDPLGSGCCCKSYLPCIKR